MACCIRELGLSNFPSNMKEFILDQRFLQITTIKSLSGFGMISTIFLHKLQKSDAKKDHFQSGLWFSPHTSAAARQSQITWINVSYFNSQIGHKLLSMMYFLTKFTLVGSSSLHALHRNYVMIPEILSAQRAFQLGSSWVRWDCSPSRPFVLSTSRL